MAHSTCTFDDCDSEIGPHGAKGMCPRHYAASRPPCSVDGCGKVSSSRGWCSMHYYRWQKTGDVDTTPSGRVNRNPDEMCAFDGCARKRRHRDWCTGHYGQWRRTGKLWPISEWAQPGQVCQVCGEACPGRRKYCSDGCRAASNRSHRPTPKRRDPGRPLSAKCTLCGKDFSLGRRDDGRLQRLDTLWCRDCGRASPDAMRHKKYGVTPEQYRSALADGCQICGRMVTVLHVDHDHSCCSPKMYRKCGKCTRGFLCGNCNRAIGLLREDASIIGRALEYVQGITQ